MALAGRGGAAGLGVKFYFIYAYKSLYLVGVKACSPGPQLVLVLKEAGREMACELVTIQKQAGTRNSCQRGIHRSDAGDRVVQCSYRAHLYHYLIIYSKGG